MTGPLFKSRLRPWLNGEDLFCYSNKIWISLRKCPYDNWLTNKAYLSAITVTDISKSFTHQRAAKISWHRYRTKLRHCHTIRNKQLKWFGVKSHRSDPHESVPSPDGMSLGSAVFAGFAVCTKHTHLGPVLCMGVPRRGSQGNLGPISFIYSSR